MAASPEYMKMMGELSAQNRAQRRALKKTWKEEGMESAMEDFAWIIIDPPDYAKNWSVVDAITCIPKVGKATVRKIGRRVPLRDGQRIKELTDEQRDGLVKWARGE